MSSQYIDRCDILKMADEEPDTRPLYRLQKGLECLSSKSYISLLTEYICSHPNPTQDDILIQAMRHCVARDRWEILARCLGINGMDEQAGMPSITVAVARWILQQKIPTAVSTILMTILQGFDIE